MDPCLIDLTFDNSCKDPKFSTPQVRLKVKDSIGGVSLQDTSKGEKTWQQDVTQIEEEDDNNPNDGSSQIIDVSDFQDLSERYLNSLYEISNLSILSFSSSNVEPEITVQVPNEKSISCSYCSQQFSLSDDLTIHLFEQHQIGTSYKCIISSVIAIISDFIFIFSS